MNSWLQKRHASCLRVQNWSAIVAKGLVEAVDRSVEPHTPGSDLLFQIIGKSFGKKPCVGAVPWDQAFGITQHSVEPFHAHFLPDLGRAFRGPGDEIK